MSKELKEGQRVRHKSETGPDMIVIGFKIDTTSRNNVLNNVGDPDRPICRYFHEPTQDWKSQDFFASELIIIDED
ncbi:MAG TPA: hypothetical protein VGE24_05820 [Emticicia sp.]